MITSIGPALVTAGGTVLAVVLTATLAVWRIRANRAYERRIKNLERLQDRSAQLAHATRLYGAEVDRVAREAQAAAAQDPTGAARSVLVESSVPDDVTQALARAQDRVVVAATRVEDATIVALNEHWRSVSERHSLDRGDVTAGQEQTARSWFDQACAQALTSPTAGLTRTARTEWLTTLNEAVDDGNSTDPEPIS